MTYKEHFSKNLVLALPVMTSQIGHVVVGFADSVMVGKVSVASLAAASFANSIFYFFFMFGIGVSYAITPLVAKNDMQSDYAGSMRVLKHGLIINLVTGLIILLVIIWCANYLHLLNQPQEVLDLALPYLIVISLSILPFMLFQTFRQFCEGLSMTHIPMVISILANVVNVVLNYILIFGKLGFEPMGLFGAGIATFISRVVMGLLMAGYVFWNKKFAKYWTHYKAIILQKAVFTRLLNIGVPAGLQFLFEVGAFAFAALMAGWLGTIPLAAHQIAINLSSFSYMMASGLAAAITIRVGNQIGNKDIPMVINVGRTSFIMVIGIMAVWALIFIVFQFWLPTIYVDDQLVITTAASLLVISAFFQLSDGLQVVGLGALRGMEDVKIPTLITFVAYWLLALPIGYFMGFTLNMGIQGIWYGLLLGLSISAIMMLIRFHLKTKNKLKIEANTKII